MPGGPLRVEAIAVGEVDVEPAVVVVVEEGEAAAFGFDDVAFVVDAAPDVGSGQAGLLRHVDELDRRLEDSVRFRGLQEAGIFPLQSGVVSASMSVLLSRREKSRENADEESS